MSGEIWYCRKCFTMLGTIETDDQGQKDLLFRASLLPKVIRRCRDFIEVECVECGEIRRWYKPAPLDSGAGQ